MVFKCLDAFIRHRISWKNTKHSFQQKSCRNWPDLTPNSLGRQPIKTNDRCVQRLYRNLIKNTSRQNRHLRGILFTLYREKTDVTWWRHASKAVRRPKLTFSMQFAWMFCSFIPFLAHIFDKSLFQLVELGKKCVWPWPLWRHWRKLQFFDWRVL